MTTTRAWIAAAPKQRALAALASALVLTLVTVLAAAPARAVDSPPPPDWGSDRYVPREMKRQLREREERDAKRRTPEAKANRRASRTKYKDKSDREALALARAKFDKLVGAPAWSGLDLAPGQRVKDYVDDFRALVQVGDKGETAIVESTLPLLNEHEEPTDLALEPAGEGFAPQAPEVALELPADLAAGVDAGEGRLRVTPETDAATDATEVDDKVFYANALTDTDVLVVPTVRGFETFHQLRSADSPEALSFDVDVAGGATLRLASAPGPDPAQRGVEVVSPGGKVVARIGAPVAADADGVPVPVSYSLEGNRVTMNVRHRERDVAYPVMVDPDYQLEDFRHWAHGNRDTYGWNFSSAGNCQWNGYFGQGWWTYGFMAYHNNGVWCNDGELGQWTFQAPRMSYIYRAEFHYQNHPYRYTCAVNGLWNAWGGNWDGGWAWVHCGDLWNHGRGHCPISNNCDWNNGAGSNIAVFRVQAQYSGPRDPGAWAELGGAAVFLRDREDPVIDSTGHNTDGRWYRSGTMTVAPRAHDDGLGMNKFQVNVPGFPDEYRRHPCGRSRCPHYWQLPNDGQGIFSFNIPDVPNGINTVTLNARDSLDKITGTNWTLNVDDEKPWLNVYGDLRNAVYAGTWSGAKTVWINSQDNHNSPYTGAPSTARSGIAAVEVYVDNVKKHSQTQNCFANCRMDLNWTFHADQYSAGNHDLRVVTRDQAGNETSSSTWTVSTRPTAPGSTDDFSDPDDSGEPEDPGDAEGVDYSCDPDPESPGVTPYCSQLDSSNTAVSQDGTEGSLTAASTFGSAGIAAGSDRWGSADQSLGTLNDPAWKSLGIKRLRIQIPWDTLLRAEGPVTYTWDARLQDNTIKHDEQFTAPQSTHIKDTYQALFEEIKRRINPPDGSTPTLKEVTTTIYSTEVSLDPDTAFNHRKYWYDPDKPIPTSYKLGARVLPTPGDRIMLGQTVGEWKRPLDECDRTTYICNVRRIMHWIRKEIGVNVKYIAAFNEPNHPSYAPGGRYSYPQLNDDAKTTNQAQTRAGATMAARYHNALALWCGSVVSTEGDKCAPVAGDFVDRGELVKKKKVYNSDGSWTRGNYDYTDSYLYWYMRRLSEKVPPFWAYHAYTAGRNRSTATLKEFYARTQPKNTKLKSQIWLTEQGPTYTGTNGNWKLCTAHPGESSPERRACQWEAGRRTMEFYVGLPEVFPRITRFYYFAMRGLLERRSDDTPIIEQAPVHDSGMYDPDLEQRPPAGSKPPDWLRPAYCVYGAVTKPPFRTVRDEQTGTRQCN